MTYWIIEDAHDTSSEPEQWAYWDCPSWMAIQWHREKFPGHEIRLFRGTV